MKIFSESNVDDFLSYYDESRERWIEVGIVSFGASAGCEVISSM